MTFNSGSYTAGQWLCDCGETPAWRTSGTERSMGKRFLRCQERPQCTFFIWEEDELRAREARSNRQTSPRASAAAPVTPTTPQSRIVIDTRPIPMFSFGASSQIVTTQTPAPQPTTHQASVLQGPAFQSSTSQAEAPQTLTSRLSAPRPPLGLQTPPSTGRTQRHVHFPSTSDASSGLSAAIWEILEADNGLKMKATTESKLEHTLDVFEAKIKSLERVNARLSAQIDELESRSATVEAD